MAGVIHSGTGFYTCVMSSLYLATREQPIYEGVDRGGGGTGIEGAELGVEGAESGVEGAGSGRRGAGRGAIVGGVWKDWRAKLLFLLENS